MRPYPGNPDVRDGIQSQITEITGQAITMPVSEAARLIGISPSTLYSLCRDNSVTHVRIRGRVLIDRSDVTRIIEQFRRGPA